MRISIFIALLLLLVVFSTLGFLQYWHQDQERGDIRSQFPFASELLVLAQEHNVITKQGAETFAYDLKHAHARDEIEVREVEDNILRILYDEAIDYSDILLQHGRTDIENYHILKANIARGKEWTKRDQAMADQLDSLAQRAAAGLVDPTAAAEQIFTTLERMKE